MKNKSIAIVLMLLITLSISTSVLATPMEGLENKNDRAVLNRIESLILLEDRMEEISTEKEFKKVKDIIKKLNVIEIDKIEDFSTKHQVVDSLGKENTLHLTRNLLKRGEPNLPMEDYSKVYIDNNQGAIIKALGVFKTYKPTLRDRYLEQFLEHIDELPNQTPKTEFLETVLTEGVFKKSHSKYRNTIIGVVIPGVIAILWCISKMLTDLEYDRKSKEREELK